VFLLPTNEFYSIVKYQMVAHNLEIGLGLTHIPLYSSSDEKLLFLFGEANMKHNCAVVSTHNLDISKDKLNDNRIIKEVIHEIGHLILGIQHCFNNKCVMCFSANVEDIDKKTLNLCKNCKSELVKIRATNNF